MKKILSVFFLACCSCIVMAQDNVIDEIVWVVGDDAILRSDIETQRLYNQNEGVRSGVLPVQFPSEKPGEMFCRGCRKYRNCFYLIVLYREIGDDN